MSSITINTEEKLYQYINKEDIEKMWDIKFTDKQWLKFVKEKQDQFASSCFDWLRDEREYYINSDDEEEEEDEEDTNGTESLITYAMSASDYKEYFNKDCDDDDDDFVTLEVECVDEPTDGVAEYSIKWKNNDNDENGIINGINTSSRMALMTCGWRCDEEEEDDEDDEDDGLEVSEIIIKEKIYLLSDNGDIYNPDTSKIVGKSENGIHTLFKIKFKVKS